MLAQARQHHGLWNKTDLHVLTRSSQAEYLKLLPQMQAIGDRAWWWFLLNGKKPHNTKVVPLYGWVNHQKLDFVQQAVRRNTFQSTHFAWFDAGTGARTVLTHASRLRPWLLST